MDIGKHIKNYWDTVFSQNELGMSEFLTDDAVINWHNSNESFNKLQFILANCKYPGNWNGYIERTEILTDNEIVVVAKVESNDVGNFRVVSFMRLCGDKICSLDEYWGDITTPPLWRVDILR